MLNAQLILLLKQSIFLLSNIVADRCPHVLKFLTVSQVYPQVLIPMFKWPQCPLEIKYDLAFCIGNVFIAADFSSIKYFLEVGLLDLLVTCLKSDSEQLVLISLTALSKLFNKTKIEEMIAFSLQDCSIIFGEFERLGGIDLLEEL